MYLPIGKCVEFIQTQAKSMGLPSTVHYMDIIETENKKPLVIITLKGRKPELSSILLTSHMDVVPVYIVCLLCTFCVSLVIYIKRK